MSSDVILKMLGFGFLLFAVAIVVICITLPFGDETKMRSMNAEMVSLLISPLSAIIGAILGLMKGNK